MLIAVKKFNNTQSKAMLQECWKRACSSKQQFQTMRLCLGAKANRNSFGSSRRKFPLNNLLRTFDRSPMGAEVFVVVFKCVCAD